MMTRENKTYLMAIATMMILIFHVWIPVFNYGSLAGSVERFLISSSYVGVDIFFFVSAYSLSSRPVQNYKDFIINRAVKLLPLFLIAWAFSHFMWFIPSLMIVYLVFPPLYKLCERKPGFSFILLFLGWAGLTWLIMGILRPHDDIGIFLFRIPIILIGAYAANIRLDISGTTKLIFGTLLFGIGIFLTYKFGYIDKLDFPFKGAFYLVGIPVTVGLVLLVSLIGKKNNAENMSSTKDITVSTSKPSSLFERFIKEPVTALSNASLETYFMQMVLGSVLVGAIFSLTHNKLITNILVMLIIILLAILLSKIYTKVVAFINEL